MPTVAPDVAPEPVVLDGHIAGAGSAHGTRLVVGRWRRSPLGGFADVMVEHPDGTRVLLAPRSDVVELITRLYTFDAVHVVPVRVVAEPTSRTWTVVAGPLRARLTIGARTPVGALLGLVPPVVVRARATAGLVDAAARAVVPGVRTRGRGRDGSTEVYAARDQHAVVALDARWGDRPLGGLRRVDPPVRFGFSSVPAAPAVTAVEVSVVATP
ncbi:hypothetical protein H9657_00780 [Cellulomonas sp. Sa3CUA2]|uniref:Uncharacterized protein n=1 Tax=Cellulomonas avistercoris TaxID=2762242 RepID=A0ABR8Q8V8_9CELL|nr:hypothetical protein [Cellulomonas avistercoris]MBD7916815.1 hypothetical protein [Cellulomonas avistercoris]